MDAEERAELEADAAKRGCAPEDLIREAGAVEVPDSGWTFYDRSRDGAGEIRATYDLDANFASEDVRAIEIGDRALSRRLVESGDDKEGHEYAQHHVKITAFPAQMDAQHREFQEHRAEAVKRNPELAKIELEA